MLRAAINLCLSNDPDKRLNFEVLRKEIFFFLIWFLCAENSESADCEAVDLIDKFGNPDLLNYEDIADKVTCLLRACETDRP
jgi:hypothetical protein